MKVTILTRCAQCASIGIDKCHWAAWCRQRPLPATVSPSKSQAVPATHPAKGSELPGTRFCINTILITASNLQILGSLCVNMKKGTGLKSQEPGAGSTPGCFLPHGFPRRTSKPPKLSLDKSDVSMTGASSTGTVNAILIPPTPALNKQPLFCPSRAL